MIIGSNSNPYKKLLEAKESKEEYYKSLMESLAEFFKYERESADRYVLDVYNISDRYSDYLCLKWINYDINRIRDIDEIHEKYKDLKNLESIYDFRRLLNDYIEENLRDYYEDNKLPLDKLDALEFIPDNEQDDYYELGSFNPGTDEDQRDYDPYTEMDINGESRYLFEVIREIPVKYINKYFDEFFEYSDIELKDLLKIKQSPDEKYLTIWYHDVGDPYASYPVGIKKGIFDEHFNDFLKEKGLLGVKSLDNTAWEEED